MSFKFHYINIVLTDCPLLHVTEIYVLCFWIPSWSILFYWLSYSVCLAKVYSASYRTTNFTFALILAYNGTPFSVQELNTSWMTPESGFDFRRERKICSPPVLPDRYWAQPASYSVAPTGSFPGNEGTWEFHVHLVTKIKEFWRCTSTRQSRHKVKVLYLYGILF
jgi:hypothetical protein